MLLFAPAAICHRDRKQILIIVWTHRGGGGGIGKKKKKKITDNKMTQSCKTAKHGGPLCPFPVPRNASCLMTRGGVGEVNDITGCARI